MEKFILQTHKNILESIDYVRDVLFIAFNTIVIIGSFYVVFFYGFPTIGIYIDGMDNIKHTPTRSSQSEIINISLKELNDSSSTIRNDNDNDNVIVLGNDLYIQEPITKYEVVSKRKPNNPTDIFYTESYF